MGVTLVILATGGVVLALAERRRLAVPAVALLVLTWFSLGVDANPLIRVYPFSGLDIARFHLFMVPLMALLAAALAQRILLLLRELWPALPRRTWAAIVTLVVVAIVAFPVVDAWKAREFMAPYQVKQEN